MQRTRTLAVSLMATLALLIACVSADMPERSQPVHFYYAATADYIGAKKVALKYAAQIGTPRDHVEKIVAVIDEVDPNLFGFEMIRRGKCEHPVAMKQFPELAAVCKLTSVNYINAATGLRLAAANLRQFAVKKETL